MDPLNTSPSQSSKKTQPQGANPTSKSTSGLHPEVNQATCIGCGLCAVLASETFAMDPMSGKAFVQNPTGDDDDTIKNAEASCPVRAITV